MELAPEKAGFSKSRLNWIHDHIQRYYIDPQKIAGCQVLVSRHGHVAYSQSFGLMDIARNRKMPDDAIFRIYSMSKPITSIALMQLYERGHFQLNDPLYRVCPEWRNHKVWLAGDGDTMETKLPNTPITFRHILSHTAGITYGRTNHPVDKLYREQNIRTDQAETLTSFVQKLANVPLRFEPGEHWLYSYSTDICGALVEAISGQPFDEYLQENIFDPLGMKDTAFHISADKQDRLTTNYVRNANKELEVFDDPESSTYLTKPAFFSGGGGLTGTLADYHLFCEMLRCKGALNGERIIGSRTLEMMQLNHLKENKDLADMAIGAFSETAYEGVGFGLGFAMTQDQVRAGGLGVGDFYWGGAASTIFWIDPVEDLIAIFMTQLMPSTSFNFRGQLKNIIYGAIEK